MQKFDSEFVPQVKIDKMAAAIKLETESILMPLDQSYMYRVEKLINDDQPESYSGSEEADSDGSAMVDAHEQVMPPNKLDDSGICTCDDFQSSGGESFGAEETNDKLNGLSECESDKETSVEQQNLSVEETTQLQASARHYALAIGNLESSSCEDLKKIEQLTEDDNFKNDQVVSFVQPTGEEQSTHHKIESANGQKPVGFVEEKTPQGYVPQPGIASDERRLSETLRLQQSQLSLSYDIDGNDDGDVPVHPETDNLSPTLSGLSLNNSVVEDLERVHDYSASERKSLSKSLSSLVSSKSCQHIKRELPSANDTFVNSCNVVDIEKLETETPNLGWQQWEMPDNDGHKTQCDGMSNEPTFTKSSDGVSKDQSYPLTEGTKRYYVNECDGMDDVSFSFKN